SGSSRQACHQSSPRSSGTTGSLRPGAGRNSDRDWSRPSERNSARSGPAKRTRTVDGPSRHVRTTWRAKKRNGAATAVVTGRLRGSGRVRTDAGSADLLGLLDGLGEALDDRHALVVGEDRLGGARDDLAGLDGGQLLPGRLADVGGLDGRGAVVHHDDVGRVLVDVLPAQALEPAAALGLGLLRGLDEVLAEGLEVLQVDGQVGAGDVE